MKNFITIISNNKVKIITRTAIVAGGIVAVTLASGLFKVVPTDAAIAAAESATKAAKAATAAAKKVVE